MPFTRYFIADIGHYRQFGLYCWPVWFVGGSFRFISLLFWALTFTNVLWKSRKWKAIDLLHTIYMDITIQDNIITLSLTMSCEQWMSLHYVTVKTSRFSLTFYYKEAWVWWHIFQCFELFFFFLLTSNILLTIIMQYPCIGISH